MPRLSEKAHWDWIHNRETVRRERRNNQQGLPGKTGLLRSLKQGIRNSIGDKTAGYDDYLLWNVVFPQHFHPKPGAKVLEVGSAPGSFLVQLHQKFGCNPYGVEYSEAGVDLNRKLFGEHGLNPENIIHSDFFSNEFLDRYRGQFDVVVSRGFIEHFTDVQSVVDRHIDLLAPGGDLIMSVPNLRGLNYWLARFLDTGAIPRHNIGIMKEKPFAALFDKSNLRRSFCGYYGTFSMYLFTANPTPMRRYTLKAGQRIQPFLNVAFRTLFGDKSLENAYTSPSLLFIGRKA